MGDRPGYISIENPRVMHIVDGGFDMNLDNTENLGVMLSQTPLIDVKDLVRLDHPRYSLRSRQTIMILNEFGSEECLSMDA
jgi:hypothetical protein